jgi:aminoglycoside/choline kinase family phosphotransferase
MTTEYYINKYMDRVLSDKTKSKLNDFYIDLVSKMMEQPFLLQHRDYHSRNIMIKDGDLFIIDLQDARLGPLAYDMASLMIDPYIDLDDDIVNDCLEHYYKGISNFIPCSYDEFIYIYRLCFLQRGIKILGTFAYQKMKNSKDKYLPYIPVTVSKLNDICGYFPEWESIIKGTVLA